MRRPAAFLASISAALATVAFVLSASPASYWLDSPEFAAAAWTLGVAHPPGHPLAALVGRLVCYLPVGTIAFRVGLASALLAAGVVALLVLISLELLQGMAGPRSARWLAAAFGGLAPAFSYAVWFNAVRAEVYALNLFLLAAAVYLLLRGRRLRDGRGVVAAAFVGGLGLCNHHLLVLLAVPGCLLLLPFRPWRRPGRRVFVVALLAAAVGLVVLAYLPLRSRSAPRVNWGAPHTVERFGWVVSAKAFQAKSVERASRETVEHRGLGALFALMGGPPTAVAAMVVGSLIFALALLGVYVLLRSGPTRLAGSGLGVLVLLNLLGPMVVGFDPFNPDAHGYLALGVALAGPLAAVALFVSARVVGRDRVPVMCALLVVALALPGLRLVFNWPRVDLRQHWAADETAREVLSLPPGALLASSYFQTIFSLWALQGIEDARPDVSVVHRNFGAQPGYLENLARRQPDLASLLQKWKGAGRLDAEALRSVAMRRYVAFEYDLNVPPALTDSLAPYGLTLHFVSQAPLHSLQQAARLHERRMDAYAGRIGAVADLETRRAMVWQHYILARYACARRIASLARFHLDAALRLAPASRHLAELRQRCRSGLNGQSAENR